MIDTDATYYHLKKICNDAVYQYTGYHPDVTVRTELPEWVFSEEYALMHDDFRLYWHAPDNATWGAGIYCEAKLYPLKNTILIDIFQDDSRVSLKHAEIPLERIRNRMFFVHLQVGLTYGISISWFDDPEYVLWSVRYTDPDNNVRHVTARARTKNEAKAIAWADSPYHEETIRPEMYTVTPYEPHELTMTNSKAYLAVLLSQADICDRYDRQATKPDLSAK